MKFSFPSDIKDEINLIDQISNKRLAAWFDEPVFKGLAPTIYDGYPYLFREAFPTLDIEEFRSLALAGRLFAQSIFAYDNVIDRSDADVAVNLMRGQAIQFEAYRELQGCFPHGSPFWNRFRRCMAEYAGACMIERQFVRGAMPWCEFTESLALRIAGGKTGIAKVAIAGLVELSQDETLFDPLVASIEHYYIGRQMWDDICDWKEDLQAGVPSLLLSRSLPNGPSEGGAEGQADRVSHSLFYNNHVQYVLHLALNSLDRADALVSDRPQLPWRGVIADVRRDCESLLKDVDRIVGQNRLRAQTQPRVALDLPPAEDPWKCLAALPLVKLVEQWHCGFGESRHVMHLAHLEGFSSESEFHSGDIFQRALIADALIDAHKALSVELHPLIRREVDYLCSQRLSKGIGGWSYFPTVPELAPDADDLGQVLQVLIRAGCVEEARFHCEGPLSVLLNDNSLPDGSFETWIVPRLFRTPLQERQAEFNTVKWGVGPDNEVMANLLYALHLYDTTRFAEIIKRGIAFLESRQAEDGSWASRWYQGSYYGTYVNLRLLGAVSPNSPAVDRALRFIRSMQKDEGGWGLETVCDPLSTSLALLGLAYSGNTDPQDADRAEHARTYLEGSQEEGGEWAAVPFIQPRMGETYASRTITHLYILKAASAWARTEILTQTRTSHPCANPI